MRELADKDLEVAKALNAAADALQDRANTLRRDALAHTRRADNWKALVSKTSTAPHLVNLLKAKGSNDPINDAAAMLDALPEFVEAHYAHFKSHMVNGEKRRRDREIVRLARRHTNKEIKARTGLSVRQIQRILKADDLGEYAR